MNNEKTKENRNVHILSTGFKVVTKNTRGGTDNITALVRKIQSETSSKTVGGSQSKDSK